MMGVTTEPEAVYEPIEDEDEIKAIECYETCAYAVACERATKVAYSKAQEPWNWLYCEKCDVYAKEGE